jgi:hypothetical protein
MYETSQLVTLADRFVEATDTKDVTLSFWVFNDSKKLAALRMGAGITVERFNDALRWFDAHWPSGATWPNSIHRPSCSISSTKEKVA